MPTQNDWAILIDYGRRPRRRANVKRDIASRT
jgi:hypothetical protein